MSRTRIFALAFAILGLILPILVLLAKAFTSAGFSPSWILYIWPSYFILGGLAGEIDAVTIGYVIISILLNVVLYAYAGSLVARLFNGRTREGRSSR
jgi:hypothetical protein